MASNTAKRPHRVYRLRESFAESFTGGLIAVGGRDFDVADALAQGDGEIVADLTDYALIAALDEYPALECDREVEADVEVAAPDESFEGADADALARSRSKGELIAAANARNLSTGGSRADLAERLIAFDADNTHDDGADDGAGE